MSTSEQEIFPKIENNFEPCDLCPFHDPKNCPAKNHSFYCEYVETELSKREDLRYYTKRLASIGKESSDKATSESAVKAKTVPNPPVTNLVQSKPQQKTISAQQWDLAVANMLSCEYRKPLPKLPGQCCKFQCNLGKGKNSMDVKQIECVRDCQLVAIGAI